MQQQLFWRWHSPPDDMVGSSDSFVTEIMNDLQHTWTKWGTTHEIRSVSTWQMFRCDLAYEERHPQNGFSLCVTLQWTTFWRSVIILPLDIKSVSNTSRYEDVCAPTLNGSSPTSVGDKNWPWINTKAPLIDCRITTSSINHWRTGSFCNHLLLIDI